MAIASTLSWAVNFAVGGLLFPIMNQYLRGLTFLPFALVLVACFIFVWKVLPEKRKATISKKELHKSTNS
jgi:uncharacterized BrkB/YihY/UPF0761 family membrane protein